MCVGGGGRCHEWAVFTNIQYFISYHRNSAFLDLKTSFAENLAELKISFMFVKDQIVLTPRDLDLLIPHIFLNNL